MTSNKSGLLTRAGSIHKNKPLQSVHRMVMENRPVDSGSIQGSHRPISFIRMKHRTRANDFL